jgi:hypothetical protein
MRPEDSFLNDHQLIAIRREADRLLQKASASGRFPTAVDDLLAAAKLTVVGDEVLNEGVLREFMRRAKAGLATIKSALSKVLGLFDAQDRLVLIDRDAPRPKIPFIKLHEAGHGTLPHQRKLYRLIHDCQQTLDPEIRDMFEREANVFASEVLFQGDVFSQEAHAQAFGIRVPMALAKKFGASNYSTFRRYVSTSPRACCVVVLELPTQDSGGRLMAEVRRVVVSKSFETLYDGRILCENVHHGHPLVDVIPALGKRMTFGREVVLVDRNGDERICEAESLNTGHQILLLLRDIRKRSRSGILMPTAHL